MHRSSWSAPGSRPPRFAPDEKALIQGSVRRIAEMAWWVWSRRLRPLPELQRNTARYPLNRTQASTRKAHATGHPAVAAAGGKARLGYYALAPQPPGLGSAYRMHGVGWSAPGTRECRRARVRPAATGRRALGNPRSCTSLPAVVSGRRTLSGRVIGQHLTHLWLMRPLSHLDAPDG